MGDLILNTITQAEFNLQGVHWHRKVMAMINGRRISSGQLKKLNTAQRKGYFSAYLAGGVLEAYNYAENVLAMEAVAVEIMPVAPNLVSPLDNDERAREQAERNEKAFPILGDVEPIAPVTPRVQENKMENVKKNKAADKMGQLNELLNNILEDNEQDPEMIRTIVREELAVRVPQKLEIVRPDLPVIELEEHRHPMFEKIFRLASSGLNVMMVGPAGCGKTHLAAQIARAMDKKFDSFPYTAGATEGQLTGKLLPTGDGGKFEYIPSGFIDMYSAEAAEARGDEGGVFLHDEIDGADANMLLVLNSALSNGGFSVEARKASGLDTFVKKASQAVNLGAANTFGTGAGVMYVGRAPLDEATRDRWYFVEMDYDSQYEAQLMGSAYNPQKAWTPASAPTQQELTELGEWVLDLRKKVESARLRRVISTRAVQKALDARRALVPASEIKKDLLAGWSKDEMAKVR